MKPQLYLLFLLLVMGCSNPKISNEKTDSGRAVVPAIKTPTEVEYYKRAKLTDTLSNGVNIQFTEITDKVYDSLHENHKTTKIPLTSFNKLATRKDSCWLVKLQNKKIDSLCNKTDDDGYYERYSIKGLWKEKNVLLVNFINWEEDHDFFLSLSNGEFYLLAPAYEISPDQNLLVGSTDLAAFPLYSGELLIARLENKEITTLYKKDLGETTITEAVWISNNQCLITTGQFEGGERVTQKKLFLVSLK